MHVGEHKEYVYFDCDQTLVLWNWTPEDQNDVIKIVALDGVETYLAPHYSHIAALKEHKENGNGIVVWSGQGAEWAKRVVESLSLTNYVDICVGKPKIAYDDSTPPFIIPNHVYLQPQAVVRKRKILMPDEI